MNTSLVLLALTVGSFLLGFLRDVFIAKAFGLSWEADLIFVALVLPLFFEQFLGLALRDAMIPYLQKLRTTSETTFRAVARWLYWRATLASLAVTGLGILVSFWLMTALAPGWTPEQVETGQLVFCVGILLIAVQGVLYCQGALLNMDRIFILPMTRTLLLNAGAIIGILLFEPSGMVIFIGMLIPQIALILLQHQRIGYVNWRMQGAQEPVGKGRGGEFGLAFAPVLLAAGAQQSCILAERMFASFLEDGNITMLSFAFRIVTIPLTLYAMSVLSVLFPQFAESWSKGEHGAHGEAIRKGLLATLLFLVPAAVVLCSFPETVVSVLLERGRFGAEESAATATLVVAYAISLPAMGLALLWGRALLAQNRARVFLLITLFSSGLTIALDALLYRTLGAQGLALAFSAGAMLQASLMGIGVYRMTPAGLGLSLLLRWAATGAAIVAALHYLPKPQGLIELVLYVLAVLVAFALGVTALGERDLFKRSYWSMKRA
ncbi:lipid II flippase MurJ [Stutzerimonas tarimensis]|uniref:Lipid II flippase MurJ n=1 Tax=Stutzerimonas tarimensis TaxID=1507735 RepID=A0ABV7T413_9GAMM